MKLSLVIPCYNEAKGLPSLIDRCRKLSLAIPCEVIFVENGSKDGSERVLAELTAGEEKLRFVKVEVNQGYGHGILEGLKVANGDIIGWTHADMQTDPLDVIPAYHRFLVAEEPNRLFTKGLRYGRPWVDRIFTMGMSLFETLLLGRVLRDVNAQPTLFPNAFFDSWRDPPGDFSLDLFAYHSAKRLQYNVLRHNVNFATRVHGTSSWNVNWRSKYNFIKRTIDYSFRLRKRLESAD